MRVIMAAFIVQLGYVSKLQSDDKNSYYDQKEYISRSVHYWRIVLPLLEKIKDRRNIPEPPDPFFKHFPSQHIQVNVQQCTNLLILVLLSLVSFTISHFFVVFVFCSELK